MNPVPLFLIIVTLPLVLGGCGGNKEDVEINKTVSRDGIRYYVNSKRPFSGTIILKHKNEKVSGRTSYQNGILNGPCSTWYDNGQKESEVNFKNGKFEGFYFKWHRNGQRFSESCFVCGELIKDSEKYWNTKGEPVKSITEAIK
ncbi:MAG: hypothetical protein CMO45_10435 [Verrucomicrobiales bacterium]|nr:hypothetical protein [Verrucomicrobiales bacterium]